MLFSHANSANKSKHERSQAFLWQSLSPVRIAKCFELCLGMVRFSFACAWLFAEKAAPQSHPSNIDPTWNALFLALTPFMLGCFRSKGQGFHLASWLSRSEALVWVVKSTPSTGTCLSFCDLEFFNDRLCSGNADTSDDWPTAKASWAKRREEGGGKHVGPRDAGGLGCRAA